MNTGQKIVLSVILYLLADIGYGLGMAYTNEFINNNSAKIKDGSELVRLLEEKKKKAGFNKKIISLIDSSGKTITASTIKNEDGTYKINFNEKYLTERTLEHELYHIIEGHCEERKNSLINYLKYYYYYYQEPKTIIHTLLE